MTLMSSSYQAAQKAAYEDAGVEQYVVITVDDGNTCEKCSEANGSVFAVKDYKIGKTAPPFHFNCRCTTMPYINKKAGKIFIKAFISEAVNTTIDNLSGTSIFSLPSKLKGIAELCLL